MNYTTTMKAAIVIVAVLGVVVITSLTVVTVLASEAVIIERQLFTIDEEEDGSLSMYDRSNGDQIAGFDNVDEMLEEIPEVIQQMEEYYAGEKITDIIVTR